MKITKGKRVRLKSKLSVKDGDVLEETVVEFFQGAGTMLPGLEQVLDGLTAGDKREGVIAAADAFGSAEHRHEKEIPRAEFGEAAIEKGAAFAATAENGQNVILRIDEVGDDVVKATMLHPLHARDIAYDVEVLKVTDPSPPPLPADAIAAETDD